MRLTGRLRRASTVAAAFALLVQFMFWPAAAGAQDLPVVRVAALTSGTLNWELDTIRAEGFDRANGFRLEVIPVAGRDAATIALRAGEAETMVADWIWVARQRGSGSDLRFLPYSRATGGLVVPADSAARTLADLRGGRIGIAGGPLDKSWLILRAYSISAHGFDLAEETDQAFGAPPLIFKAALDGEFDGAINFWHFLARMKARGMRELISVDEAAEALGLSRDTPLLGYVFRGDWVAAHPDLVRGFATASRQAKSLLATDDAAWERLRADMPARDDAEFEALKAGFRAGIPEPGPVDIGNARAVFALMAKLGGADLTGKATELPGDVFLDLDGL